MSSKPKRKYLLSSDTDSSSPDPQERVKKPERKITLRKNYYKLSSDSESSEEKLTKKPVVPRKKRRYELSSDSES